MLKCVTQWRKLQEKLGATVFSALWLVGFRVKHSEVVAAQMVEHPRLLEVVAFGEDAHVSVSFNYFSDVNSVVARCKFAVHSAF